MLKTYFESVWIVCKGNNVVDPNPDSQSGCGSRRAKMTQKNIKQLNKFHLLKCGMFSFEGSRLL
jgi:hypothetical protein